MMLIDQKPWSRRHDDRGRPIVPSPPFRCYPNSRQDLIDLLNLALKNFDANAPTVMPEVRASGSHWALSEAALSHDYFAETQNPERLPPNYSPPRLNRTLFDVIPSCLTANADAFFQTLVAAAGSFHDTKIANDTLFALSHVEAGTRLYELYSRLDHPEELPLALQTMGGAAGQTIVGAFSTGTHGGDVLFPPLADCVMAIHLIAPVLVETPGSLLVRTAKAAEFWIERGDGPFPPLVDQAKLQAVYPPFPEEAGPITVIRDNDVFDAVLVSAGRMGLIYSVVLRVGWQYCLRQIRKKDTWSNVKSWINDPTSAEFPQPPTTPNPPPADPRFVQVVVNPNAQPGTQNEHTCWITFNRKQPVGPTPPGPPGRKERRGDLIPGSDPEEFQNAGCQIPYSNNSPGLFNIVCSSPSPIQQLIEKLLLDAATVLTGLVFLAFVTQSPVVAVAAAAALTVVQVLTAVLAITPSGSIGKSIGLICNLCAKNNAFWVVDEVAEFVMNSQQPTPWDETAISYAILDTHDYTDVGCDVNIDSLEVFFDAADPQKNNPLLINYVENIFQRIDELQSGAPWANNTPRAFAGYVSLRFMSKSEGLIAMQQFHNTCSLEIAGFNTVLGTAPFLRRIEMDAVAMGGTVHWGQHNDLTMPMVEQAYGTGTSSPLTRWRQALSRFSAGGRLQSFSTDFSRKRGLEIVQPTIKSFTVAPTLAPTGTLATVVWHSGDAPGPTLGGPGTTATLKIGPSGQAIALGAVDGTISVAIPAGLSNFIMVLENTLNGQTFTAVSNTIQVRGT